MERGMFMGKFCKKCGKAVGKTDLFCQSCGAKLDQEKPVQTVTREEAMASLKNSQGKKSGKGCLIVILAVVLVIAFLIFLGASAENRPTSEVITDSIGVSEEEANAIQAVLEECGVVNAFEFTHDEMLDGAHKENELGYRVNAENAKNVILYLNEDYTVNMVRWNDVDLYKDGAVITTIETEASRPDLEVLSTSDESDGYTRYVVGEIKNNSAKTYSYVQVEIGLYQGETLVGSTLDNVTNLEPGQTWSFKALVVDDTADNYKITGVTGY